MSEEHKQSQSTSENLAEPVEALAAIETAPAAPTVVVRPHWFWDRTIRFVAYWFNLFAQPILAIGAITGMVFLFGYAQKNHDWFNNAKSSASTETVEEDSLFACSMLCVFVKAPGRCPVCGMELQKIESQGDPKDLFGVTIDPTARRLANIKTVAALNMPVASETEVHGRIAYDETTEATVAAYVDGRIEDLVVDFTGATIRKGDELAVIYSPDLYADQVGLIQAKQGASKRSSNERVNKSNQRLYQSARRRLIELGIPESQVDSIEAIGTPNSRIKIYSPMSGTVVEKMVDKGTTLKTGMPILKIADLSKVWLMLEMYSEDTTNLKLGQSVSVTIQSQVGKTFEGKVSFIDPMVNSKTQTVKVRVVIPNDAGLIKIGDFGKAKIQSSRGSTEQLVIVPRESVLMNGANSVAYVETEPGRFEFRKVEVAEIMKDMVSIASGIKPGEQVVASGVFMLDSTFNIQGKVSLIDPNRAEPKNESQLAKDKAEALEIEESFSGLSPEDRTLAETQIICPVSAVKLGTKGMGVPIRVKLAKRDIMICCEGCRGPVEEDPDKHYAILEAFHSSSPTPEEQAEIEKSFADLSPTDRKLAEEQIICPVTEVRLGTMGMGTPINVNVYGTPVMICCEGCRKGLLADPDKHFAILESYHRGESPKTDSVETNQDSTDFPEMDLPEMDLPEMELPQMELPQMEAPK